MKKRSKYNQAREEPNMPPEQENLPIIRQKLRPHTKNHANYLKAIKKSTVTLCYGPAGTGKTYMACGLAAQMLLDGTIKKIVLTRPAVECGEKLGFLPGVLKQKLGPFVLPLYDALSDFLSLKEIKDFCKQEIIEIVPLAYMRGRTLRDAFIILDEAQNCKYSQLKMLLTRFGGEHPKVVLTGDITQSDIPYSERNGKNDFQKIIENLQNVDGISTCEMDELDVMRHPLIIEILKRL